ASVSAGSGAGWVVVLESARRGLHRCVCGIVADGWFSTGVVFAKLWQWRFRARSLHVFAVDRICDSCGDGPAAIAVLQEMECAGSARMRGHRVVHCICRRITGTAGVLGKRL